MDLYTLLVESAKKEGFPLAGAVDLDLAFTDPSNLIQKHIQHFDQWIEAGYAGSMAYLARGRDRRANPRLLFPQAQSIFCVAIPYPRKSAGATLASEGPRYARYLQGQDYHLEIHKKLQTVMQFVKQSWKAPPSQPPLDWKICVDTSAVLERTWAALAGLGWIGKNTLLIHPKHGSYLFLGEVLINQQTGQSPSPVPNLCGHCTRCLESCPTQALEPPNILNSNLCVSYQTLEKKGEISFNKYNEQKMGTWVAGCDVCQEVCPFNFKPCRDEELRFLQTGAFEPLSSNATHLQTWHELLVESPEDYLKRVQDSAMKRIKPAQFSRNLAISLKNALSDFKREPLTFQLSHLIQQRIATEQDPHARRAWIECLEKWNLVKLELAVSEFT